MTREEAIKVLKNIKFGIFIDTYFDEPEKIVSKENEALEIAIKALEQQPCEDCISRQIISDYVGSHIQEINTGYGDLNKHTNEILRMIIDYIESMPSVTPTRPTARWERLVEDYNKCSKCGEMGKLYRIYKYCPNCGAKMEEQNDRRTDQGLY